MCTMTDISIRCVILAMLAIVISAMPFMGMDDWTAKDTAFEDQTNLDKLRPDLVDPSTDVFNSISQELERVASPDPVESLEDNDLVSTHRAKRFGFGLLPMGFSYRIPIFPRRNRRINSRNYVAMRGKRLQQLDGLEFNAVNPFGSQESSEVSKRRGFTALRGR